VEGDLELARQVFKRGYDDLRNKGLKSERVAVLEVWRSFEEKHGTPADVAKVQEMFPIVSLKRVYDPETDTHVEDWVMVFKDDEREANPTSFKFLQMAHAWKAKGKKVLPILSGSGGGKPDEEGDEGGDEDANGTEGKDKGKGKAREDGDDEASDMASSHGGDDSD